MGAQATAVVVIHAPTSQDDVFAFLAQPSTHGSAPVHRIDTHGAAVFLAGSHAFKIKERYVFRSGGQTGHFRLLGPLSFVGTRPLSSLPGRIGSLS